nr:hypothetical protein [uncultured bacterium]
MVDRPPFCVWCPLTNRRKTGCEAELFLKNPKKYFEGFLSGVSRMAGFGEGTPQQDSRRGKMSDKRILVLR